MSMRFTFSNKKVLVTGASQGIGEALCEELVRCGAKVFALARSEYALRALEVKHSSVTAIVCDVTASAEEIASKLEEHQPFDCLVNNAGVAYNEAFLECSVEAIDRTFAVNLRAPIVISKIVSNEMIKNGIKGSIVNVSSQASLRPLDNHTAYCSSKSGLDMAARCMANELGEHGIRVNNVNPTVVLTEMGRQNWSDPAKAGPLLGQMSIRRFAECSDVISSILFLLSDASQMTTGAVLPVDGGFSTH